jgi:hypothetical protein
MSHANLMDLSGRGTASDEDVRGTPTQIHISPSILVYEDYLGVDGEAPQQRGQLRVLHYCQPSERDPINNFQFLDSYRRSPESGGRLQNTRNKLRLRGTTPECGMG